VFVIAGRNSVEAADTKEFFTEVERQNVRASTYVFPTADIKGLLSRCEQTSPLLTDDFAPVDVLMSSQFVRRENPEL
jgi:hypothetical protein